MPNLERDCYIYETDGANALKPEIYQNPQLRLVTESSGGEKPPLSSNIISFTEFQTKKAEQLLISKRNALLPSASFLKNLKQEVTAITSQIKQSEVKQSPLVETPKQSEKLHTAHQEEGQLFVCDVSLYRNLYNEYMEFSGGDKDMARRNVLLAITKDSTSLIQENISALKEKDKFGREKRVVDDDRIQAELQQTPTQHEFYEKIDSTGERILCSPEHLELEKDYTKTVTRFRRGNDLAAAFLRKELVLTSSEGTSVSNVSPRADNEGPLIEECAGEYGYFYRGEVFLTEAGMRKVIIHSIKVDGNTSTFLKIMENMDGKSHIASFDDVDPSNPYSPSRENPMDVLMRTAITSDKEMSTKDLISAFYRAKGEVEGPNERGDITMFGIKEETMLKVQNPELIKRVESEVSTKVAQWLLGQIESGVPNEVIQSQVRAKYISEVKAFVAKVKAEREEVKRLASIQESNYRNYDGTKATFYNSLSEIPISAAELALVEDLRRRTQTKGAFCGTWGESSSSLSFSSDSISDLSNYTGISGGRINSIGGGGGLSVKGEICFKHQEEKCEGRCYKCEP